MKLEEELLGGDNTEESERIVSPEPVVMDSNNDSALRPKRLSDYIGQTQVRENLSMAIKAALKRGDTLDHVLFHGFPGLGKTTLSYIIAAEMGAGVKMTSGPVIEKQGDLAAILTSLQEGDVLFIDEIHRLNHVVEEILYPAMEDYQLDLIIGQGPGARSVKMDLPKFTLVGATTRTGLLTAPLRDRFGLSLRFVFYSSEELVAIIKRSASLLSMTIDDSGALELGKRSRGTPRIANRLLRRVRDYAEVGEHPVVNAKVAGDALNLLGVDQFGLDEMDRRIMLTILEKFDGGPIGLDTLATVVCEEKTTLEDVYEPFLIQSGFVKRTPRGRVATVTAYEHFGKKVPRGYQSEQPLLFDD